MRVAVVVSGWPRVSETFALNELLALDRAGMLASIFATKPGDRTLRQPGLDRLEPLVEVLPDVDAAAQGAEVAGLLAGRGVAGVHGYFAHRPTEVAAAAAHRLGVPFGFSAHALDIRKVSHDELAARAGGAAVVVTCNADAAASVGATGTEPCVIGHGVDLGRFTASPLPAGHPPSVLAVGRLVEKKGFHVLVEAAAMLRRPFRLRIVGDGPERPRLDRMIVEHRLGDRVEILARRTHVELPTLYRQANAVVVPSVVDGAGDRDGLPNVVLEAMAAGRPVVASDVAAIGTAVTDSSGVLVPPGDPRRLARALDELLDDPERARRLGAAARAVAEDRFDLDLCGRAFCDAIGRSYG